MRVIPAVDLREGECVQLVGGDYAAEAVRLPDPLAVAQRWRVAGFAELHVVDLDAATGRGANAATVEALAGLGGFEVQVGGGVRDTMRVQRLLDAGATRVVVGTRALLEPEWLNELAAAFPGRVVLAADVRDGRLTTHGWTRVLPLALEDAVSTWDALALAGLLVTSVQLEGRMQGPDLEMLASLRPRTRHALFASGGIGTYQDLTRLEGIGMDAVIVGMALYTGAIEAEAAARFGR
ncbi:MAG: 1-(5-phosphoribosyl)-5-[(5-phosphoribosylamino)methylideneamino] imidazole-4-carboxamide isomerase [Candidatus Eisenbacteria bacterium]